MGGIRKLQLRRKGILGLFLWVIIFFICSMIYFIIKGEMSSFVGVAGGLAGVISGLIAFETLYDVRLSKLPTLTIYPDHTSRYSLFQIAIKNNGGGAAFNIKLEWLTSYNGSSYELPINCYGSTAGYTKFGDFKTIKSLGSGDKHLFVFDGYNQIYKRYTSNKAIFLAKLTYYDNLSLRDMSEEMIELSFEEYRSTLNYTSEETKTLYELQKIPKLLKEISEKIN